MAYEKEEKQPVGGPLEFEAPVEGEGIDEEQHRKGGARPAGEQTVCYCKTCGARLEPELTTCPAGCETPGEFAVGESEEESDDFGCGHA